jgi:hypothetical protein
VFLGGTNSIALLLVRWSLGGIKLGIGNSYEGAEC